MPNHNRNNRFPQRRKPKVENDAATDDNPVLQAFRKYAQELDAKHDRNERIVKLSRDITIDSKRIIFLLHTINQQNRSKVLEEAQQRIDKLISRNFHQVAKELHGHDPYQYRWAYSPGLQEFVEAYTFMEYLYNEECENINERKSISDWKGIQEQMTYEEVMEKKENEQDEGTEISESEVQEPTPDSKLQKFEFFIDPTEYILGVSDLTGELMRRCINSLGMGNTKVCLDSCKVLQLLYTGYLSLNISRGREQRELSRKIFTMRQSVLKTENACYNVKVRGGEAAKWGAVFDKPSEYVDEGYF